MSRPATDTYPSHFEPYVKLVNEEDLKSALRAQSSDAENFLKTISEEKSFHRYAEKKWTIKEVLQHIIDAERVFTYRALAFARGDKNNLPSFDENGYAANSRANERTWQDLISEFSANRKASEMMFNSFSEEVLDNSGSSNNHPVTVRALGYITVGHLTHHLNIIKERYLTS
ncbi:MAG: DinB family protein [Ginsengibacter sp.]|jgi:uncharacterized damage-inducible protein DinB